VARAIAACHGAGGGRVVVPAGVWLTGAIHLKSNVNLHLAAGATLRFSPEPAKYLPVVLTRFEGIECMNFSPLVLRVRAAQRRDHRPGHARWLGHLGDVVGVERQVQRRAAEAGRGSQNSTSRAPPAGR